MMVTRLIFPYSEQSCYKYQYQGRGQDRPAGKVKVCAYYKEYTDEWQGGQEQVSVNPDSPRSYIGCSPLEPFV